jgi:SAM domain (Sterile alpha motif)
VSEPTKEISIWLEKLGMSEYAQRFAENGIDVSVLRYLSDQDLEKIGVLLGHRRKMLAVIAQLERSHRLISGKMTSYAVTQRRCRPM